MRAFSLGAVLRHFSVATIVLVAAACGGGSDSGGEVGVFVDSPVAGIGYRTFNDAEVQTREGITNANGEFSYTQGETVQFFVGSIILSDRFTPASSVVTVLDITDAADTDDQFALNVARLLQSLDDDNDPSNGISIPASAITSADTPIDLDVDKATFESSISDLMSDTGNTLIDEATAKENLEDGLDDGEILAALLDSTILISEPNNIGGTAYVAIVYDANNTLQDFHTDDTANPVSTEYSNAYTASLRGGTWVLEGDELTETLQGEGPESYFLELDGEDLYYYETANAKEQGPGNEEGIASFAHEFEASKLTGNTYQLNIPNSISQSQFPVVIVFNANGQGTLKDDDEVSAEAITWTINSFGHLVLGFSDGEVTVFGEALSESGGDYDEISLIAYETFPGIEEMFAGTMVLVP